MSNDSKTIPDLAKAMTDSAQAPAQPRWTLENDWPGNNPPSAVGKGTNAGETISGRAELARHESYGELGIYGPSYT